MIYLWQRIELANVHILKIITITEAFGIDPIACAWVESASLIQAKIAYRLKLHTTILKRSFYLLQPVIIRIKEHKRLLSQSN